jgi:Ca2+-binding RTX toxin-like protein
MKKAALISILVALALAPASAHARERASEREPRINLLLAGGAEANMISIRLSKDGQSYVIDSVVQLETGGDVCRNPPGNPFELVCQAAPIGSLEVNAGPGNDVVTVAKGVKVPVTMRGGGGRDALTGGAGPDKLIGGRGADRLVGRSGADLLYGGPGPDVLIGGWGNDVLRGGLGRNRYKDRHGRNRVRR